MPFPGTYIISSIIPACHASQSGLENGSWNVGSDPVELSEGSMDSPPSDLLESATAGGSGSPNVATRLLESATAGGSGSPNVELVVIE